MPPRHENGNGDERASRIERLQLWILFVVLMVGLILALLIIVHATNTSRVLDYEQGMLKERVKRNEQRLNEQQGRGIPPPRPEPLSHPDVE